MNKLWKFWKGPAKYPLIVSVITAALFALGWWLLHDKHIPVLMPSGEIGAQQRDLIVFTVLLAAVVVVPVFVLLTVFALKYREGNTKARYQPEWGENKWLELIWWGIPIIIIVVLSIVTWMTSHSLDPYRAIKSDKPALEVKVVALQWKWLFIYPEQGMASVNDLTIPVDRPVHFTLSADAPMSAFWIPDLGSQIYSMNAMSSQLNLVANKTGSYKGYNTNINGEGYAKMVFTTHAVSDEQFDSWVDAAHHGKSLTKASYAVLASPSVPSEPSYYHLAEADIYEQIVAQYHQSHDTSDDETGTAESEHDTMEHMHHMEGN